MFPGNCWGMMLFPSVQGAQDDLASTTFCRLGDPITVAQITGLWVWPMAFTDLSMGYCAGYSLPHASKSTPKESKGWVVQVR